MTEEICNMEWIIRKEVQYSFKLTVAKNIKNSIKGQKRPTKKLKAQTFYMRKVGTS